MVRPCANHFQLQPIESAASLDCSQPAIQTCGSGRDSQSFSTYVSYRIGIAATFHFVFTARASDLPLPQSWTHDGHDLLAKGVLLLGLAVWLSLVGSLLMFHTFLATTGWVLESFQDCSRKNGPWTDCMTFMTWDRNLLLSALLHFECVMIKRGWQVKMSRVEL